MWRREVSRGAHNGVRRVRPVPVSRRVMIPYPFTRIPFLECRSGSVRRQGGVHAWDSGRVTRAVEGARPGAPERCGVSSARETCDIVLAWRSD
ncbi:hypothetical protein GCM10017687_77820 [Streptomyces echinatus]